MIRNDALVRISAEIALANRGRLSAPILLHMGQTKLQHTRNSSDGETSTRRTHRGGSPRNTLTMYFVYS